MARAPTQVRRPLRLIVGSLLAVLALAALGVWRAFHVADETIAEHRALLPAERAAVAAMPRGRPALVEPAMPGEATDVIHAFLAAVDAVPLADRERMFSGLLSETVLKAADEVLHAHPEPLAALEPLLRVASNSTPAPDMESAHLGCGFAVETRRSGVRWLQAASDRALAHGEVSRTLRVALLLAALGHEGARSSTINLLGLDTRIERSGTRRLAAALAAGPVDADEAHRLGVVLDRLEASRVPLGWFLAVERCRFRAFLTDPSLDDQPWTKDFKWDDGPGWRSLWSRRIERASELLRLNGLFEELARQSADADENARAFGEQVAMKAGWRKDPGRDLAWLGSVQCDCLISTRELARATSLVARVGLAVAESSARQGKLPGSLQELVPEFLPSVPIDPWSGKPVRYGDGKVWSVGPDGKDDGGTPLADPEAEDLLGDIVARVAAPR